MFSGELKFTDMSMETPCNVQHQPGHVEPEICPIDFNAGDFNI